MFFNQEQNETNFIDNTNEPKSFTNKRNNSKTHCAWIRLSKSLPLLKTVEAFISTKIALSRGATLSDW